MDAEDSEFEFQLKQQKLEHEQVAVEKDSEGSGSTTYTDPSDGTVYEWDSSKRAWFPKIDDNFIALYQASYGVNQETPSSNPSTEPPNNPSASLPTNPSNNHSTSGQNVEEVKTSTASNKEGNPEGAFPKRRKTDEGWFEMDNDRNTNVYVNGLPLDVTEEEFVELMSKYGIIKENEDETPKVKLYKDEKGELKGDGLCCYLKKESVDLAIQLLHDSSYRGYRVYVERAHFELKGKYRPDLKKKKPSHGKKKKDQQNKLLGWKENLGPKRSKFDKIVVLENMFDPVEFKRNPASLQDIREDVREECEKFGVVRKLMVFDRNPNGVISVGFRDFESADLCVEAMQGRYFDGKVIKAHPWDGVTVYHVQESEEEKSKRLKDWEKFLEEDNNDSESSKS